MTPIFLVLLRIVPHYIRITDLDVAIKIVAPKILFINEGGKRLQSSLQKEKPKETIAVLDGVRAFACLCVILFHINNLTMSEHIWTQQTVGKYISSFLLSGSYGVTLFFVLSGFLLFRTYTRSLLFDVPWPSMKRFYIRRIFRIWPGYYISLIILILLVHPEFLQVAHWSQLALFLTFFMDSTKSTYEMINGPFWTLAVEWQYYVFLPFIALGFRWLVQRGSLQRRLTVLILCLLGMMAWGVLTKFWGSQQIWLIQPDHPISRLHRLVLFFVYGYDGKFMEDFAIGMLISVFYTLAQQIPEHVLARTFRRYSRWIFVLGVVVLAFAVEWPATFLLHPLTPYIGAHLWLNQMPYALGFGLCILAMLFGSGYCKLFFEWGPMRKLGQLSYGMYIWHLPFIFLFSSFFVPYLLHHAWPGYIIYGLFLADVALLTIPFCNIFYRLVEKPGMIFGDRFTRSKPTAEARNIGPSA